MSITLQNGGVPICDYAGAIEMIQAEILPLNVLVNTEDNNTDSKTSSFSVQKPVTVLEGAAATAAMSEVGCHLNVAETCQEWSSGEITADYPIVANHSFKKCLGTYTENQLANALGMTAQTFALKEGNHILSALGTAATALTATGNASDKLIALLKEMAKAGITKGEVTILATEFVSFDIAKEEFACCDFQTANSAIGSSMQNKLQVTIIVVPAIYTTNFDMLVYYKPYALFKRFCDVPVKVETIGVTANTLEKYDKVVGMTYIKCDYISTTPSTIFKIGTGNASVPQTKISDEIKAK